MFVQTVFRVEFDLQAVHTVVLLRLEDSFEACISQTHVVLVLLILKHQKGVPTVDVPGKTVARPPTNLYSDGYVFWRPIQASRCAARSSKLSMELFIPTPATPSCQDICVVNPLYIL
jgi:hypothetical protein